MPCVGPERSCKVPTTSWLSDVGSAQPRGKRYLSRGRTKIREVRYGAQFMPLGGGPG